jgi:integrase
MSVHTKTDGRVFVVRYERGKHIWQSFGRGPEALASARAYDLERQIQQLRGESSRSYGAPSASFGEIAQLYINARQKELSDKSRAEILRLLSRPQLEALLIKNIHDITLLDWIRVQDQFLARGTGNRSINIYFRYLSPILKWCVANQYLTENPWRDRVSLKQAKYHIDLMSIDELHKLISVAPDHLAWAMTVAYYTGMRPGPSELFAARWEHVDWEGRRIHIYASKTKTWRWQYFHDDFYHQLKARHQTYLLQCRAVEEKKKSGKKAKEVSPHICTYRRRPITSLKVSLAQAVAASGINRHVRLYDIRHLHITHALAGGAPIGELAERVGHVDPTMIVKVYAHMVDDIRTQQAFKIPKIMPKKATRARFVPALVRQPLDKTRKKGQANHA